MILVQLNDTLGHKLNLLHMILSSLNCSVLDLLLLSFSFCLFFPRGDELQLMNSTCVAYLKRMMLFV